MKLSDEFKNELYNLAPYIAKYIVNLNMSNVKFNFNKKMIAGTYAIKNAHNVKDVMEFELKYFEDNNIVAVKNGLFIVLKMFWFIQWIFVSGVIGKAIPIVFRYYSEFLKSLI